MPHHPHHETGITDEAAEEAHDIIDRAEEEEEKLHPHLSNESNAPSTQAKMMDDGKKTMPSAAPSDKSNFDKLKDKFNMSK